MMIAPTPSGARGDVDQPQVCAEEFGRAEARLLRPGFGLRGEKTDVAGGARNIVIDAFADRLADIARFEQAEIARPFFDFVGEAVQDFAARLGAHPRPRSVVGGGAGGGDRVIDVVRAGIGDFGEKRSGGRFDIGETRAAARPFIASVDKESGFHRDCAPPRPRIEGVTVRAVPFRNIVQPAAPNQQLSLWIFACRC